jgi:outer membrane protein
MYNRTTNHPWMLMSTAAALALTCFSAAAQDRPTPDDEGTPQLALGLGVVSGPKYPGSSVRETRALPLISARYGRFFIGGAPETGVPLGVGANLFEDSNWRLGVVVGRDLKSPRKASDDPRLTGLGDIASTTHLGVFGSYTQDGWSLRGNVLSDVGGEHEGTTANLELVGKYQLTDQLSLSAGPGLAWANKRYTQTFFGVDATQAANSGLTPYDANSGLNSVKFSLGLEYRIDRHWFVSALASVESLRGDARSSPITSDTSPHTIGVFAGYRF